eukprot:scaffold252220_cov29-Prasinocladus_malaysianus.AAC.2
MQRDNKRHGWECRQVALGFLSVSINWGLSQAVSGRNYSLALMFTRGSCCNPLICPEILTNGIHPAV